MSLVGFLDAWQFSFDRHLHAEFLEEGEQFPPLAVPPQANHRGTASGPVQRSLHGVGQERGEVVDRGPSVNRRVGEQNTALLCDHHPEVVRLVLHDRLGQCLKVGLPGFVTQGEPFQAGLDEGHALAEIELLLLGHDRFPSTIRR